MIDLSSWAFDREGVAALDGEWLFVAGQFLTPAEAKTLSGDDTDIIRVPKNWNAKWGGRGIGYGTYILHMRLPREKQSLTLLLRNSATSAYKLFLDSEELGESGIVAQDSAASRPEFLPKEFTFETEGDEVLLTIHVSNFEHDSGGIKRNVYLGSPEAVANHRGDRFRADFALMIGLFCMGTYHLLLFFFKKESQSALYFSVFCVLMILRLLFVGEIYITEFLPWIPWGVALRAEYLDFILALPMFTLFFRSLFPLEIHRLVLLFMLILSGLFSIGILVLPSLYFTKLLLPWQIILGSFVIYIPAVTIWAWKKGREGSKTLLMGNTFVSLALINDILYNQQIINTGYFFPLGFSAFMFSQAFVINTKLSNSPKRFASIRNRILETEQGKPNASEVLKYLSKENFKGDVPLTPKSCILFCEIRNFQAFSAGLSSSELLSVVGSFLEQARKCVQKSQGRIQDFSGDGFFAVFPEADQSLQCALALLESTKSGNQLRLEKGKLPNRLGMGIHQMNSSDLRSDSSSSKMTDLVGKIESLCNILDADILITEEARDSLSDSFLIRSLGRTPLSADYTDSLFEVLDGKGEYQRELYLATMEDFRKGLVAFSTKDFPSSRDHFGKVIEIHPGDEAARYFYHKSVYLIENGYSDGWDRIEDYLSFLP